MKVKHGYKKAILLSIITLVFAFFGSSTCEAGISGVVGNQQVKVQRYCNGLGRKLIASSTKPTLKKKNVKIPVSKKKKLKLSKAKKRVVWRTTNPKIATVKNGVVKGNKAGKAIITATSGKHKSRCQVTVYQPAKKVKLKTIVTYVEKDSLFTVGASFTPRNATYRKLTWSVKGNNKKKPVVIKVSGNKFKAKNIGKATIYAYQEDTGKRYSLQVTVKEKIGSYHLEYNGKQVESIDTTVGSRSHIEAVFDTEQNRKQGKKIKFKYKVADQSIVKVNSHGEMMAKTRGITTVTVVAPNNKKKVYTVSVKKVDTYSLDSVYTVNKQHFVGYGNYGRSSNYSKCDETIINKFTDNTLGIFYRIPGKDKILMMDHYNSKLEYIESKEIQLPYDLFGSIFFGTDHNIYIVVGQSNEEEDNHKVVFSVIKYNENFDVLGRVDITGEQCGTRIPFYEGNCRMDMDSSNNLVLYTSRKRYSKYEGIQNQSNLTCVINTAIMRISYIGSSASYNHVYNSYNQFVKFDHGNVIYVDHGNAYPRSINMQTHYAFNPYEINNQWATQIGSKIDLMRIAGEAGQPITGVKVNGFETGRYNNIVAGVALPQDLSATSIFASQNNEGMNVYAILCSKGGISSKTIWLTKYSKASRKTATNLRMVKIDEDHFALLYSIYNGTTDNHTLDLKVIDSNGNVLKSEEYDIYFSAFVQPIIYDKSIVWVDASSYQKMMNIQDVLRYQEDGLLGEQELKELRERKINSEELGKLQSIYGIKINK